MERISSLREQRVNSHPVVRQGDVVSLCVKLKSHERDVWRNPGHHHLHRLILGYTDVLKGPGQKDHPVCRREETAVVKKQSLTQSLTESLTESLKFN